MVKLAQSDADKKALEQISAVRSEVLALNKQAGEIKLTGDIAALRTIRAVSGRHYRYVDSLESFVKLQEQQRDAQSSSPAASPTTRGLVGLGRARPGLLLAGPWPCVGLTRSITRPLAKPWS